MSFDTVSNCCPDCGEPMGAADEIERLRAGLHLESKLRQQYHIERDALQAKLKQANAVVERVSKLPDEWMWKAQSENGPATVKMMSILAGQLEKALAELKTDDD